MPNSSVQLFTAQAFFPPTHEILTPSHSYPQPPALSSIPKSSPPSQYPNTHITALSISQELSPNPHPISCAFLRGSLAKKKFFLPFLSFISFLTASLSFFFFLAFPFLFFLFHFSLFFFSLTLFPFFFPHVPSLCATVRFDAFPLVYDLCLLFVPLFF